MKQKNNVEHYRNHCCGCGVCIHSCPVNAIEMQVNHQGFLYPVIDSQACINCGKCVKACAFNQQRAKTEKVSVLSAYAVKHRNEEIRAASRSGGVFTALSDRVLSNGGVIYGCVLEHNCEAVHIRAESREDRDRCRGSKYIQSRMDRVLPQVRQDLQQGREVLFSGTACQIHAVVQYCKDVDTGKLLLVDMVCYGVPSPKVWEDYLDDLSSSHKKQIATVEFRDKKFGWDTHYETVRFTDGTEHSGEVFSKLFGSRYILRENCFECPYKNLNRIGDITIGDCWGIGKHYPEFNDNKGISLVMVNTAKGCSYFPNLENIECIEVQIEKLLQPALTGNWKMPDGYCDFWDYYCSHSFRKTVEKFIEPKVSLIIRFKAKAFGLLMKLKGMFSR